MGDIGKTQICLPCVYAHRHWYNNITPLLCSYNPADANDSFSNNAELLAVDCSFSRCYRRNLLISQGQALAQSLETGGPSKTLENAGLCVLALGMQFTLPHTGILLIP
jgi:hypothetical protein